MNEEYGRRDVLRRGAGTAASMGVLGTAGCLVDKDYSDEETLDEESEEQQTERGERQSCDPYCNKKDDTFMQRVEIPEGEYEEFVFEIAEPGWVEFDYEVLEGPDLEPLLLTYDRGESSEFEQYHNHEKLDPVETWVPDEAFDDLRHDLDPDRYALVFDNSTRGPTRYEGDRNARPDPVTANIEAACGIYGD